MTDSMPILDIRDACGHRSPFRPARLRRSILRATVDAGRGDPFLAAELCEATLLLLPDAVGGSPTAAAVAERVEVILRELGQPAVALAYARRREAGESLDGDALPPDLLALHRAGLVEVVGLDGPPRLAGVAVDGQALGDAADAAGRFVAFDRVEAGLLAAGADPAAWWGGVVDALEAAGLRAVVNVATPERAGDVPLFPTSSDAALADVRRQIAAGFVARPGPTQLAWHLPAGCDATADHRAVADLFAAELPVVAAFDRPRQPVVLADGLARGVSGVLAELRVRLDRLAADGSDFPALGRACVAVGRAWRQQLRQAAVPALQRAFRIDRAWLLVRVGGFGRYAGRDGAERLKLVWRSVIGPLRQAAGSQFPVAVATDEPLDLGLDTHATFAAWSSWAAEAGPLTAVGAVPDAAALVAVGRLPFLGRVAAASFFRAK